MVFSRAHITGRARLGLARYTIGGTTRGGGQRATPSLPWQCRAAWAGTSRCRSGTAGAEARRTRAGRLGSANRTGRLGREARNPWPAGSAASLRAPSSGKRPLKRVDAADRCCGTRSCLACAVVPVEAQGCGVLIMPRRTARRRLAAKLTVYCGWKQTNRATCDDQP